MNYVLLKQAPLFSGLSEHDIETILKKLPYRINKFSAGNIIYLAGEKVNSLSIVLDGIVKGEMVDYAGRIIKIEDIAAPGALASAFIFGRNNCYPVNVVSVSATHLLVIEKEDFMKLLMTNDKILVNFLNMISNRSQFLSEKIKFLNFKTIKGKLAYFLLQKAGNNLSSIHLDVTQNEIADFFGVARPSIGRVIGELEEDGCILAQGKNIRIINKEALAELTLDY